MLTNLDIAKLRQETPACANLVHFNNAGASLSPIAVINAVKKHLDLEASIGGYEAENAALNQTEKVYDFSAALLNCTREEIAFVENATRAWDMVFYSLNLKPGDKILTGLSEYASNYLAMLQVSKRTGAVIEVIGNDSYGQLDIVELRKKIDSRVKLIAITHVPTQGGLINPAVEIGEIAHKNNILYLLDATQSIGQMPVDVKKIRCDFLCATGRKYLRGPRGTGLLYIKNSRISELEPIFIDLHSAKWVADNEYSLRSDGRRFETWEQNIAAKVGLAAALEYLLKLDVSVVWERIQYLSSKLRHDLSEISGVRVQDMGLNKCGIVTFTAKNKTPMEIHQELLKQKVNTSVSIQEYARLDLAKRNITSLIRASVHYYNTEEEIERFCAALQKILL